jgi:hypothetical protein
LDSWAAYILSQLLTIKNYSQKVKKVSRLPTCLAFLPSRSGALLRNVEYKPMKGERFLFPCSIVLLWQYHIENCELFLPLTLSTTPSCFAKQAGLLGPMEVRRLAYRMPISWA